MPVEKEGGLRGWMTIAGAWLIQFSTFGYVYSYGVYQDYYTRVFLTNHTPSSIAWIGSFQLMMPFALGLVSGKLFDAGYFHHLIVLGSVIFTFSLFMVSLAQPNQYYQVFLSQGLGMGLGIGLVFVPTASICALHFKRRKALATGIVFSGSSAGGLVFPIMLNHLLLSKGYANAVRYTAYIVLGCLTIGNLLMRKPLPTNTQKPVPPMIASFFREPEYLMTILGYVSFLMFYGIFFPVVYLQLYAVLHKVDGNLAFYSLAILNACSFVGRIFGNFFADTYGAWNLLIPTTAIAGGTIWAVLGVHDEATLIVVAMVYGFFSGAWLSLSFAALGSLAQSPSEIGYAARTGLVLAISSLGCLFAAPTQGALLSRTYLWIRPIAFSSVSTLSLMLNLEIS
ncbi:uncharacterized protein LACBIDRAFT_250673 [Laccaria bicolor S238N-H82]|uniref:Predicted protein n=1 Tax=Laccaria bicolor (strain S238N-H82 / ATCC MYA-4686) TaxID=486041 RepID=B0DDP0_LACBS|nr:uncharacterized protein LACBIDRAFT_250673 [Laccaria bicolor S238N-H82]EDR07247.1 predicted protein [Laccaria bicolor S238N-H82]|eukprot:XP_001882178.1 predicted protein [Laccaria bicolor S238N-H82]